MAPARRMNAIMVAKQRFDSPESLYNRPRPLPKPQRVRLGRGAKKRRDALERRLAWRLSSAGISSAMAKLATDDAEGQARRRIAWELAATVPDWSTLTDDQRAVLIAVRRDGDLGLPGPMDWHLLLARFGLLPRPPSIAATQAAREQHFKADQRARRLATAHAVD